MSDLLTKAIECGMWLVVLGVVVGIGIAWFFKIKNKLQKKAMHDKSINELRKLGEVK